MSGAIKTGLVIVGVAGAVYLVAKFVSRPPLGAPPTTVKSGNGWDIGGTISAVSSVVGTIGDWFRSSPTTSTTQGIDPTTGGVYLAPGDTYGPAYP